MSTTHGTYTGDFKVSVVKYMYNTGATLLDAIVLAVVFREPEGTYGYKIAQDERSF